MSLQQQEVNSAIPDLRNLSLDRLAGLRRFGPRAVNRAVRSAAFGNRRAAELVQCNDLGTLVLLTRGKTPLMTDAAAWSA